MAKESITHSEYLQLVGLYTVAGTLKREMERCLESANAIVGGDKDTMDNHVNEVLWDHNPTADGLVKSMNLAVEPPVKHEVVHFSDDATTAKCGDSMKGDEHKITTCSELVGCELCLKYMEGFDAGKAVSQ